MNENALKALTEKVMGTPDPESEKVFAPFFDRLCSEFVGIDSKQGIETGYRGGLYEIKLAKKMMYPKANSCLTFVFVSKTVLPPEDHENEHLVDLFQLVRFVYINGRVYHDLVLGLIGEDRKAFFAERSLQVAKTYEPHLIAQIDGKDYIIMEQDNFPTTAPFINYFCAWAKAFYDNTAEIREIDILDVFGINPSDFMEGAA